MCMKDLGEHQSAVLPHVWPVPPAGISQFQHGRGDSQPNGSASKRVHRLIVARWVSHSCQDGLVEVEGERWEQVSSSEIESQPRYRLLEGPDPEKRRTVMNKNG